MVRPDAKMDGSKPISGGVPFCFPQFGPGEMQQHGFARNLEWEVAETSDGEASARRAAPAARLKSGAAFSAAARPAGDAPSIVLKLVDNEYTRSMCAAPGPPRHEPTRA